MRNVLPIILFVYFSPIFAHAVDEPCSVKGFTTIPRQELFELGNCGLQFRKFVSQDFINHHFVIWPIGWNRIEPFQLGENLSVESNGSVSEGIVSVQSRFNLKTEPRHTKCAANPKQPQVSSRENNTVDIHLLYPMIPMLVMEAIVALFIIYYTHND